MSRICSAEWLSGVYGLSKKKISDECLKTYQKINGYASMRKIIDGGCSFESIEELYQKRVIVYKLKKEQIKKDRKKVLVISPHLDDVALSLSGMIAKTYKTNEYFVLDIFGHQEYTLYQKFTNALNYLESEEKTFWSFLDIKGKICGFYDAPLRKVYSQELIIGSCFSAVEIIKNERGLYKKIFDIINLIMSKNVYDTVVLPMGIGNHIDHILVREAGINCCKRYNSNLLFFRDMPYSLSYPSNINLQNAFGVSSEKIAVDITDYIHIKEDALKIYQSQITKKNIEAVLKYGLSNERYYEYFVKQSLT